MTNVHIYQDQLERKIMMTRKWIKIFLNIHEIRTIIFYMVYYLCVFFLENECHSRITNPVHPITK